MLSHDRMTLVSGPADGKVRFWDLGADRFLRDIPVAGTSLWAMSQAHCALALDPVGDPESVVPFDARDGQPLQRLTAAACWVVPDAACSPDGRTLAAGREPWPELYGQDDCCETVALWDVASGRQLRLLKGEVPDRTDAPGIVMAVAFSPDGLGLAAGAWGGRRSPTITFWDAAAGQPLRLLVGHDVPIHALGYAPGGWTSASGDEGGTVAVWDLGADRKLHKMLGHAGRINAVAFSPDGRLLASADEDGTVKVWDLWAGGREVRTQTGYAAAIVSIAFWPDSRTLASEASDRTVLIWDAFTALERKRCNPWAAETP